jgi:serine protease Do
VSRAESGGDRYEDLKTAPFYNEKYRKPGKGRMKGLVGPMIAIGLVCSLIGSAITGGVVYAYRSDLFASLAPQPSAQPSVPADNTVRKVEILNRTDEPITAIAEKAGPSVVGINVEYTYNDSFFGAQPGGGQGSGIIISADGYILTNNHVVEAAANTGTSRTRFSNTGRITVVLPSHPDEPYEATIIGLDAKTDIAVIKIDAQNLPVAEIGDSDNLVIGELAVAIGNPAGLEYMGSVTSGIISGLNRRVDTGGGNMLRLIQTDAAISPGNSGGALLNAEGQVIGVNSSKIGGTSYEGLGFAIPIKDAMDIADSLMADGFVVRPQIGVSIDNTFTAEVARANKVPEGVLVGSVMEDSPADEAGIRQYDIITAFNGVEVKTYDELEEQKNKFSPGDVVTLTVYRIPEGAQPSAGESKEISLTLGSTANSN